MSNRELAREGAYKLKELTIELGLAAGLTHAESLTVALKLIPDTSETYLM